MDGPIVPIPPDIGANAGPVLLAYFLIWFFYGILCLQLYRYYQAFPLDPKFLKAIVYLMFTLETLQAILITHDGFDIFARNYGNLIVFDDIHFTWFTGPVLSGIVSVLAQLFYAHRIMSFSRSVAGRIVAGVIAIIALLQCSAAIAGGVQARNVGKLSEVPEKTYVATSVWLAGAAVCDIMISASMTWLLANSGTFFKETKDIIARLIRLTIETGFITALFAVLDLTLFLAFPRYTYHVVPAFCLGKVYSNALLVVLNNRAHIANARDRHSLHIVTGSLNSIDFSTDAVPVDSMIMTRPSEFSVVSNVQDNRLQPLRREEVERVPGSAPSHDSDSGKYGKASVTGSRLV
uniref:DUF6534 domain-containing protein n=1 Tax=Moniliophthora roreri TaxID=221103 RepID=A0A0W0F0J5_MONRR